MPPAPTKEPTQTEPTPIETTGFSPSITPSEPLESSTTNDTPSLANNDNQGILSENNPIISIESEKPLENQDSVPESNEIKPEIEKIPEKPENLTIETETPVSTLQTPTAQIPVSEPLASEPASVPDSSEAKPEIENEPKEEVKLEPISEPIKSEPKPTEQIPEIKPEPKQETKPEQPKPIPEVIPAISVIPKSKTFARELLVKARNMIQFRKRKKLDKIMTLFAKQTKITNDEVEKFLHFSDATATRYLSQLEKEGKIKQNGKTGKSVFYTLVK
jgi:hypothetical protein